MKTGQKGKKGGTECGFCAAKIIGIGQRYVLLKKLVATSYTSCSYTQHLFNSLQNEIVGRSMKSRTDLVHSYVNIAVNINIYHCGGFYHHGSVLFIILQEYICHFVFVVLRILTWSHQTRL